MSSTHKDGVRPRILFYSHDGIGLGHLRRTLALAGEIARRRPDAALLALTGSTQVSSFALPANLELVKLPSVGAAPFLSDLRPVAGSGYRRRGLWALREALIYETARVVDPHLVIIDNLPAGLLGEVARALTMLDAQKPRAAIVLELNDLLNEPAATRKDWEREDADRLLDRLYDRILVLGSRDVFDPTAMYAFSESAAARTTFCGYFAPPAPSIPPETVRARLGAIDRPLVVVTIGGGQLGGSILEAYLTALRNPALGLGGVTSFVVAGPLLAAEERERLAAIAATLPMVTFTRFVDDLPSHLNAADVVVTKGGYNTLAEAVGLHKRVIVVPRDDGWVEQRLRAERFAALGLVSVILPATLTPERLSEAVRDALNTQASPPDVLDFDGLRRAGDALVEVLNERAPLWPARALPADPGARRTTL